MIVKMTEQIEKICRYCLEDIDPLKDDVVRPCKCTNYIHHKCYNIWNVSKDKNITECDVCKTSFIIISKNVAIYDQEKADKHRNNILWFILMSISISLGFLWDFKYFTNYKDGEPLVQLLFFQYLAILFSSLGTFIILDTICRFTMNSEIKKRSFLQRLLSISTLSSFNEFCNYILVILMILLISTIVFMFCTIFGDKIPYRSTFLILGIILMSLSVIMNMMVASFFSFNEKTFIYKKGFSRLWEVLVVVLGQILIQLIGCIALTSIMINDKVWNNYIVKPTTYPNVFTHAFGTVTILTILLMIQMVCQFFHLFGKICKYVYKNMYEYLFPKSIVDRLGEYDIELENNTIKEEIQTKS